MSLIQLVLTRPYLAIYDLGLPALPTITFFALQLD